MTDIALITGATSGIGAEFAVQLAVRGYDLILVARNEVRLRAGCEDLRRRHGVNTDYIVADLLTDSGVGAVVARLENAMDPVTLLINNAGFGLTPSFAESGIEEELAQLKILVTTPMQLSHAALRSMAARRGGRIINVASVAGFLPRGTYGAAKAWVISFSRWANIAYQPSRISVTAVCPGFVRTEFHQRMGAEISNIPAWMWLAPERVVADALAAASAGKGVSVPSRRYKVLTFGSRYLPAGFVARLAARGR